MSKLAINGGEPIRTKGWPTWPQWGAAEQKNLLEVLESGQWGGYNEKVKEFETLFGKRHEAAYCLAATNGTQTLEAALRVVDVGFGDEVIVPPYTFIATANAPRLVGATPVFVDIDPETYNLDIKQVEAAITPKTKAIIPVHLAGLPADMDALMPLAEKHGLYVIEDAAHAHGSTWHGKPVGTIGHIGSFSLQASKNLNAGEGGVLLTNHEALANKLGSYINQGRSLNGAWYEHPILGNNLRITGWQAAILLAQMERFDAQLQRRQENARRLHNILAEVDGLTPQAWDERCEVHAHHIFIMRYDATQWKELPRERFVQALRAEGVPLSVAYTVPLYDQPPLAAPHSRSLPCPVTEHVCHQEGTWMGQSTLLAEPEDIDDIARAIFKVREAIDEL
ncbi:MAG: DegT/DnrJ/EryC1/StrS family aminotransferase [Caldilineaceae bacterium]|nr:DegT/DnrJ/EryC1/StrS family aminotransferase [Caldilineaceae bacterium]